MHSTAQHSTAQHSTAQHSTNFRLIASAFFALSLTACGGGGGGGTPAASNTAPVVADVSGTVIEDTPKAVTLPGTDADGNALTYAVVTSPLHGAVTLSGGIATYTPTLNYHGADSFTYKANDGTADSATATVSITVTPVNDVPTANAGSATTAEDTAKAITLVGADVDGDTLTYTKVTDPAHGTVSISGNTATYTPNLNSNGSGTIGDSGAYTGSDTFTYKANDGTVDSTTATVSITVTPVNDAPVADPFAETADAGVAKSFDLRGSDVDNLVTTRTAAITVQPQHGTATLSGLRVTYTPDISYSGNDILKYTLSDGTATSNEAQVTIVVSPSPVVQPTPTGKLNDTGITQCGDYAYGSGSGTHNSDVSCALTVDANSDPVPPSNRIDGAGNPTGQDGHVGRDADAATNDNADGSAGFNFTKISSTGAALPASATEWSCVKDNVTGLIWEVKTDDNGLHDKDWTYTWFDTNTATNGGGNGTADGGSCGSPATSQCDTSGYVTAVNTAGWCGATSGWRMPSVTELQSIADLSRNNPAIDTDYFPNTIANNWYWSGTPYANNASYAWAVGFGSGDDYWYLRSLGYAVRLVRSGQ